MRFLRVKNMFYKKIIMLFVLVSIVAGGTYLVQNSSISFSGADASLNQNEVSISIRGNALKTKSEFSLQDKIIMTPYYYWYDIPSGFTNPDTFTMHPSSNNPPFSYKEVSWHEKEFKDMTSAGIDIALPVYWGFPDFVTETGSWVYDGINPMVVAARNLVNQKIQIPKIGMYYDTSSLLWYNPFGSPINLITDEGKGYFYGTIKQYFESIPKDLWATIDGRPVVVLWGAGDTVNSESKLYMPHDDTLFNYANEQFKKDFGTNLFIIKDTSWKPNADSSTRWGAAIYGPQINQSIQIGPGYDDSNLPDRIPHSIKDRENGEWYINNWKIVLDHVVNNITNASNSIVIIETWNEFFEGSGIADSSEYGSKYISLTNKFGNIWKKKDNNSSFGSQKIPVYIAPRVAQAISVTFKNTGNTIWSGPAGYTVRSVTGTVFGLFEVAIPKDVFVHPGQSITFNLPIYTTNPNEEYVMLWQMYQDGVGFFGNTSRKISVTTSKSSQPIKSPSPTIFILDATMTPKSSKTPRIKERLLEAPMNR